MSRRQRSLRAPAVRPTYTKILDHAMAVLNEDGFDRFSVQRVLDTAEVSRATLYRHFPDVDSLIEAALVENFRGVVDMYLGMVVDMVERSVDVNDFRDAVRSFLATFSAIPPTVRLQRTHTIALASTRPDLAEAIGTVQETLTDGWAAAFHEAQRRGFMRPDLDTRAAAVIIQSMGLGRIVDDAATTQLGNQRWAQAMFELVDLALLMPSG
jgi:AcrR family transcriptional regulator